MLHWTSVRNCRVIALPRLGGMEEGGGGGAEGEGGEVGRQRGRAATTGAVRGFEHGMGFGEAEVSRLEDGELESMEGSEGLEGQKGLGDEAMASDEKVLER